MATSFLQMCFKGRATLMQAVQMAHGRDTSPPRSSSCPERLGANYHRSVRNWQQLVPKKKNRMHCWLG